MPVHTCSSIPFGVTARWTYVPDEEIDFKIYENIRHLLIDCYNIMDPFVDTPSRIIECWNPCLPTNIECSIGINVNLVLRTVQKGPYILPSICERFPQLESLIIKNVYNDCISNTPVFIKLLTDIPDTLISLEIENTLIQNIGEVVINAPQLLFLQVRNNHYPNTITSLPPKLIRFHTFKENFINNIYVFKKIQSVYIMASHLPGILNLNPDYIHAIMIRGGIHPYDETQINMDSIHSIKHINYVNAQQMYAHFGSIPRRVSISYDNTNPIIVALNLASNYPRRMCEFMSYV